MDWGVSMAWQVNDVMRNGRGASSSGVVAVALPGLQDHLPRDSNTP